MQDVASRAGVSVSTVSIVLNDKPGVSQQTRVTVLRAARELDYRLPAQRLPASTMAVVHYASPDAPPDAEATGLPPRYLAGIQEYAGEHGISLTVLTGYREGDPLHIGREILEGDGARFDGLILIMCPSRESRTLQRAVAEGIPTVAISRDWPNLPISTVGQDHGQQARLALEHLVALGHRRIGFLAASGDLSYDWYQVRLDAYRRTVEPLGWWSEDLVAVGDDPGAAALALLERRPDATALFAVSDPNACSAMRALTRSGISVPDDISVTGLDDSLAAPAGCPGLTSVAFPHQRAGYLAAKVLHEHLADDELAYSRVYLNSWLVRRGSTAEPRADDRRLFEPRASLSGAKVAADLRAGLGSPPGSAS
jgi:LacI family transcriptional regulator